MKNSSAAEMIKIIPRMIKCRLNFLLLKLLFANDNEMEKPAMKRNKAGSSGTILYKKSMAPLLPEVLSNIRAAC